jgi:hypothetical protein
MPAATSAATSAATPSTGSVNSAVGYPTTEKYPGAVSPSQYTDPGPQYPIEGPAAVTPSPYGTSAPEAAAGGGIVDLTFTSGTDGPSTPWDSSAGQPFAPSGAVNPALHADDGSGAVAAFQTVVPAFIGKLTRKTPTGQTWNREYAFDPVDGMNVPQQNGRVDFDQIQEWDPHPDDGQPWEVPYAERPVLLNVAYTAQPVTSMPDPWGVSGLLPDRSQWNAYAAETYAAPPDPIVNQPATPAPSTSSGWLLG